VSTAFYLDSPMAIANTILKNVNINTEFFVVRIGMYKKEETAKLSNMLRPNIVIMHNWNKEELKFYHNVNNLLQTKAEIIHGLQKNGIVVFDGNSDIIFELSKKTQKK